MAMRSFGQHIRLAGNTLIENWWKNTRHIKKQGPSNDDPVTPSTTWLMSCCKYRNFFPFCNFFHNFSKNSLLQSSLGLRLINRSHINRKVTFIKHYLNPPTPPSWMCIELLYFSELSKIRQNKSRKTPGRSSAPSSVRSDYLLTLKSPPDIFVNRSRPITF